MKAGVKVAGENYVTRCTVRQKDDQWKLSIVLGFDQPDSHRHVGRVTLATHYAPKEQDLFKIFDNFSKANPHIAKYIEGNVTRTLLLFNGEWTD